jgi:hypothetical protein
LDHLNDFNGNILDGCTWQTWPDKPLFYLGDEDLICNTITAFNGDWPLDAQLNLLQQLAIIY